MISTVSLTRPHVSTPTKRKRDPIADCLSLEEQLLRELEDEIEDENVAHLSRETAPDQQTKKFVSLSPPKKRQCVKRVKSVKIEESNKQQNGAVSVPPSLKSQLLTTAVQFNSALKVTKEVTCSVCLTLVNDKMASSIPANLFLAPVKLSIADFASKDLLEPLSKERRVEFEIRGNDENARCALSYLRGLLTRKDEVAVAPLSHTGYQLLIYEKDSFTVRTTTATPVDSLSSLIPSNCQQRAKDLPAISPHQLSMENAFSILNTNLCACLIPKFSMVFDLDETLIRTRVPQPNEGPVSKGEKEFFVHGSRYMCSIRPGTELVLKWATQLFTVHIFTNSIYEYAREVCKILDPTRETILARIDIDTEQELRKILKTREQMTPVDYIAKPLGLKDLTKFSIGLWDTIVLDDDAKIWRHRQNVLPFDQIAQFRGADDFFYKTRIESWKLLATLAKNKSKALNKQPAANDVVQPAVSAIIVDSSTPQQQQHMGIPQGISYSQRHVMEMCTRTRVPQS